MSLAPLCTLHVQMNWSKASSATDLLQSVPTRLLWPRGMAGSLKWLQGGQQGEHFAVYVDYMVMEHFFSGKMTIHDI